MVRLGNPVIPSYRDLPPFSFDPIYGQNRNLHEKDSDFMD